jgi:predicted HAD superfamily Cof-like phosphohydrolase
MIGNVAEFHEKFGLPLGDGDQLTNNLDATSFRLKFLQEELDELAEALADSNRVKAFDALLDLAYVTYGTALFMGVNPSQWHAGMHAVHSCNMAKVRVAKAEDSKRGSAYDVKKPVGWVGPETRLEEILSWNNSR